MLLALPHEVCLLGDVAEAIEALTREVFALLGVPLLDGREAPLRAVVFMASELIALLNGGTTFLAVGQVRSVPGAAIERLVIADLGASSTLELIVAFQSVSALLSLIIVALSVSFQLKQIIGLANVSIKTRYSPLNLSLRVLHEGFVEYLDLVHVGARLLSLLIAQVVSAVIVHLSMLAKDLARRLVFVDEDRGWAICVCLKRQLVQGTAALARGRLV